MKGQLRIEEMYAFICLDEDDTEGIPAFKQGPMMLPMVGADMSRVDFLRGLAQEIADSGRKVTLVRFTNRETLEEFLPDPRAAGVTGWLCEAHGVVTSGDCDQCTDELIALTEDEKKEHG